MGEFVGQVGQDLAGLGMIFVAQRGDGQQQPRVRAQVVAFFRR